MGIFQQPKKRAMGFCYPWPFAVGKMSLSPRVDDRSYKRFHNTNKSHIPGRRSNESSSLFNLPNTASQSCQGMVRTCPPLSAYPSARSSRIGLDARRAPSPNLRDGRLSGEIGHIDATGTRPLERTVPAGQKVRRPNPWPGFCISCFGKAQGNEERGSCYVASGQPQRGS